MESEEEQSQKQEKIQQRMRPWKTVEESFIREFANSYSFFIIIIIQQILIKLLMYNSHSFSQQGHVVTNQA